MNLNETQIELLTTIQKNLRRKDINTIAQNTGLSREYVSRVLSPFRDDFNEDIVSEAVKIISAREQNTKTLLKKLTSAA